MKLYYAGFCVWLLLLVVMLTGCSEFEAKIEEMNQESWRDKTPVTHYD